MGQGANIFAYNRFLSLVPRQHSGAHQLHGAEHILKSAALCVGPQILAEIAVQLQAEFQASKPDVMIIYACDSLLGWAVMREYMKAHLICLEYHSPSYHQINSQRSTVSLQRPGCCQVSHNSSSYPNFPLINQARKRAKTLITPPIAFSTSSFFLIWVIVMTTQTSRWGRLPTLMTVPSSTSW
jgi:hypothetical protein